MAGVPRYEVVDDFDANAVANYEFDITLFICAVTKMRTIDTDHNPQLAIQFLWRVSEVVEGSDVWAHRTDHFSIAYEPAKNSTEEYDWFMWFTTNDKTRATNALLELMGRDGRVCFIPIICHLLIYG